jgi:hypothetical protein
MTVPNKVPQQQYRYLLCFYKQYKATLVFRFRRDRRVLLVEEPSDLLSQGTEKIGLPSSGRKHANAKGFYKT